MRKFVLACALALATALPAAAQQVRVIDGDTFEMDGRRIRLLNIDAPEIGQTCRDAAGQAWRCGEAAANALRALVARGPVRCAADDVDLYGRDLAHCTAGGADIGGALVAQGLAVAFVRYSDEYLDAEIAAFKSGKGMWAGSFVRPEVHRRTAWSTSAGEAPRADCPIKGNINSKGERIYHTPYSRHYGRTKIDEARGERWFCTETEALEAGWRAPYW
ncbi:thermonuclease family protein [Rhodobacteraceae bacterium 2CG4]|uniref:Thermonuclease family protein n=1 Tax=Halovulum marinum TaxID=2662447 RepID=A0A6L5YZX5_9RHOB|nr:thermonuclease family protein [Halovulum marinum]MSU89422.1 thermonuclease family protein [Halovulum marinum]